MSRPQATLAIEVQQENTQMIKRQDERMGAPKKPEVFRESKFRIICSHEPRSKEAPNKYHGQYNIDF
jgi:hypothetical protein